MVEILHDGKTLIIRVLAIDLDMHIIPKFREAVHSAVAEKPSLVLLDLAKVEGMDSSGLGAIFYLQKSLREIGGELELVNPRKKVSEILKITRSDDHLKINPGEEKASQNQ